MASDNIYDVLIIGSGPAGLACAIDAQKANLSCLVLEKGSLVNSIFHFPVNMIFFSTPELLEIGDVPLIIQTEKPTRADMLKYYRLVSEHHRLNIKLFERVESVTGTVGEFTVASTKGSYRARNVVVATGQYDNPNLMAVPGENLPKVSHYYTEAHSFYRKKVAVIGGKNSAVEAALELYKNGVDVTIIHRHDDFGKSVKYWILPDIKNRVKEGKIKALFNTVITDIREDTIIVRDAQGRESELENDFVFALIGYNPDTGFLTQMGVELQSRYTPVHNPNTLETNVPGIYIAGVITAGSEGSKVFIENSREHGTKIIGHILNGQNRKC